MRFRPVRVQRPSSFSVRRWTLSVRRFPSQFEFEMRFRSVRVQRLPRFAIDRHAAEVPFL